MTRAVWRIAADTPRYVADEISGEGAKRSGGRWNEVGMPLVYASESGALACIETFVHFEGADLPLNRYLVQIDIPDAVWAAASAWTAGTLPIGWDAHPPGMVSIREGSAWLASKVSCVLLVPSSIIPEEVNVLINPEHADCRKIKAKKIRRWLYDPRMRS